MRAKLRSAIQGAQQSGARFVVTGGRIAYGADGEIFDIVAEPIVHDGQDLLLVCFVETPDVPGLRAPARRRGASSRRRTRTGAASDQAGTANRRPQSRNVERRADGDQRRGAVRQRGISIHQRGAARLEGGTAIAQRGAEALNSQLQETLERQRTTADDLQNVLYSTDVATIFLDTQFNIRFFTPATRALFNVIPGDVGRPLTDLTSLASDGDLLPDAQQVLRRKRRSSARSRASTASGSSRRILPYRTRDKKTEGVVITFDGRDRTAAHGARR